MKLTILKGIAHDLANNLDMEISIYNSFKNLKFPVDSNILERKNSFDIHCAEFFKSRIPENFDRNRIKKIIVSIDKPCVMGGKIKIKILVDNKEINYS